MSERLQTTLLFLHRNDKILLAMKKRGHGEGKWNGIGGKIEPGETIEQAAIRECEEEIGVRAVELVKVGILSFYQRPPVNKYLSNDCHVFVCSKWQGTPTETEEMMPVWFNENEIPFDLMWEDDKHWLPMLLAGKKFTGKLTFDENYQFIEHSLAEIQSLGEV